MYKRQLLPPLRQNPGAAHAAKMLIPLDINLTALRPYRPSWKSLDKMKLCGILVMFFVDISAKKTTNLGIRTRPWFMARWKAHVPLSIRVN